MSATYGVEVASITKTVVLVEADSPEQAKALVEGFSDSDVEKAATFASTPHDRYLVKVIVEGYERTETLRGEYVQDEEADDGWSPVPRTQAARTDTTDRPGGAMTFPDMTKPFVTLNGEEHTADQIEALQSYDFGRDVRYPENVVAGPPRNAFRAQRVSSALAEYARRSNAMGEPLEQNVRDLLCDLMHFADLMGEQISQDNFLALMARAQDAYNSEAAGGE